MHFIDIKKPPALLGFLYLLSLILLHNITEARAQKSFLDLVPTETPYFINYKLPFAVSDFIPKTLKAPTEAEIMNEQDPGMHMLGLLIRDFVVHLKSGDLTKLGLTELKDLQLGLYGLGLWPVLSLSVHSQANFTEWIARSAKKSGVQLKRSGKSLLISTRFDPSFKSSLAISFIGSSWVNFALVPEVFSQNMLPYLSGQRLPKSSIVSSKQLAKWVKESEGHKNGISYISFHRIFKILLGRGEGLNQNFAWIDDSITKLVSKPCVADYLELSKAVPYLLTGIKQDTRHTKYHGKTLLKFSDSLAKVTQTFMPKSLYIEENDQALTSMSFGVNIRKILEGLHTLIQQRIHNPFKCQHLLKIGLDPQTLQMRSSQLMMIPPFAYDIHGFSFSIDDIKGSPKGTLIISANNVVNLINIAKSMNPHLAQIKLPAVGQGPQKLEQPTPSMTVMVELEKNALGLSSGKEQTKLVSTVLKRPVISKPDLFSMSYDLRRISKSVISFLKAIKTTQRKIAEAEYQTRVDLAKAEGKEPPPAPHFGNDDEAIAMLEKMNFGQTKLSMRFTKEGLEIRFGSDQLNIK